MTISPVVRSVVRSVVTNRGGRSASLPPTTAEQPVLWLDADRDASFSVDAFTGEINTWTSRDSNARVFSPVNVASQTRLQRISRSNWQNRRIVTSEITANRGFVCPTFDMSTLVDVDGKSMTVIAVYRTDDNANGFGTLFYQSNDGGAKTYSHRINGTSAGVEETLFLDGGAGGGPLKGSNTNYCFGENIITMKRTATQATNYVNGAQEATVGSTCNAMVATTNAVMYIGASGAGGGSGIMGDIAEICFFASALSDVVRIQWENYLAAKWLGL